MLSFSLIFAFAVADDMFKWFPKVSIVIPTSFGLILGWLIVPATTLMAKVKFDEKGIKLPILFFTFKNTESKDKSLESDIQNKKIFCLLNTTRLFRLVLMLKEFWAYLIKAKSTDSVFSTI